MAPSRVPTITQPYVAALDVTLPLRHTGNREWAAPLQAAASAHTAAEYCTVPGTASSLLQGAACSYHSNGPTMGFSE